MGQTEATRQFYWTLPPLTDATGTSNVAVLPVTFAPSIVDLTTVPGVPTTVDRSIQALEPNPEGHFITMIAQGGDIYYTFGSTYASLTSTEVASATVAIGGGGSGYAVVPTAAFSGGGGAGATATATINNVGQVATVVVTGSGSGYTGVPTIAFTNGPGGSGSGAVATANMGAPPVAATATTLTAATGVLTIVKGTAGFLPSGTLTRIKLPVGSPEVGPWGQAAPARYLGFVSGGSGATATLRLWQSSVI